jgi:hypothetical protein
LVNCPGINPFFSGRSLKHYGRMVQKSPEDRALNWDYPPVNPEFLSENY